MCNVEDKKFLAQCEQEFSNRFTDQEEEFRIYCASRLTVTSPPILKDWMSFNTNQAMNPNHNNYFKGHGHQDKYYFNSRNNYQNRECPQTRYRY